MPGGCLACPIEPKQEALVFMQRWGVSSPPPVLLRTMGMDASAVRVYEQNSHGANCLHRLLRSLPSFGLKEEKGRKRSRACL